MNFVKTANSFVFSKKTFYHLSRTFVIKFTIAAPRLVAHSITSAWLTSTMTSYVGLHSLVMSETAKHFMPQWRAATTREFVKKSFASQLFGNSSVKIDERIGIFKNGEYLPS